MSHPNQITKYLPQVLNGIEVSTLSRPQHELYIFKWAKFLDNFSRVTLYYMKMDWGIVDVLILFNKLFCTLQRLQCPSTWPRVQHQLQNIPNTNTFLPQNCTVFFTHLESIHSPWCRLLPAITSHQVKLTPYSVFIGEGQSRFLVIFADQTAGKCAVSPTAGHTHSGHTHTEITIYLTSYVACSVKPITHYEPVHHPILPRSFFFGGVPAASET